MTDARVKAIGAAIVARNRARWASQGYRPGATPSLCARFDREFRNVLGRTRAATPDHRARRGAKPGRSDAA